MATTRFSKREIEILRSLKEVREREDGEGDTSWIDNLPEMPDLSVEGSVLVIMRPKREETGESNA
jgi:hypothetical protein